MFWFDNSRKNLVSYARSFNQKERDQVEKIFAEIIRNEHGTKAPVLRFNSSDARVIDGYEIVFVKALYRASLDKTCCIQEINHCLHKDGLIFSENDEDKFIISPITAFSYKGGL